MRKLKAQVGLYESKGCLVRNNTCNDERRFYNVELGKVAANDLAVGRLLCILELYGDVSKRNTRWSFCHERYLKSGHMSWYGSSLY